MKLNFLYEGMLSAYCLMSKSSFHSWGITLFFLFLFVCLGIIIFNQDIPFCIVFRNL